MFHGFFRRGFGCRLERVWKSPSGRWQKRKPGRRKGKRRYPIQPGSLAALARINRARRLRELGLTEEEARAAFMASRAIPSS
jgi:hypothetical protein